MPWIIAAAVIVIGAVIAVVLVAGGSGDDTSASAVTTTVAAATTTAATSETTTASPSTTAKPAKPSTTSSVATTVPRTTAAPTTTRAAPVTTVSTTLATTTTVPFDPPIPVEELREFVRKYRLFVTKDRAYDDNGVASLDQCPIGSPRDSAQVITGLANATEQDVVLHQTDAAFGYIDCLLAADPYSFGFGVDEYAWLATHDDMQDPNFLGLDGITSRLLSYEIRDWQGTQLREACWRLSTGADRCEISWHLLPDADVAFGIRVVGDPGTIDPNYLFTLVQSVGPQAIRSFNFLVSSIG